MKKVLLGTSAIALAGAMATPAAAVEWDVNFGGYMNQHVGAGFTDIDNAAVSDDFDGVDVHNNSEVFFTPSITLDNGLQFGVNIQLEGLSGGDNIDESFMFIDGSFGEINIGDENSAGYKMTYAAPNVTSMPINSGSISTFIPIFGGAGVGGLNGGVFRAAKGSSYTEVAANNDAARITYYSPRFAGLQVGVSYARDGNQDQNAQVNLDNPGQLGNIFDVGANYVNSFGGFDVALSARWGIAQIEGQSDDPQTMAFGANLGFSGFTVGYAFSENNNSGALDSQGHSAGVSYETGPWGVSATYFRGEGVDGDAGVPLGADEEYQAVIVGGSYALAQGVGLSAYGAYVDVDEDFSDGGGAGGNDIEGFIIGTGVNLSF